MAPGVIQNTETIIGPSLDAIAGNNADLIEVLASPDEGKTCPIDHLAFSQLSVPAKDASDKSKVNGQVNKIEILKLDKKQPRKVIRPKVLKNIESREYLYDRLYDSTCPRAVSSFVNRKTLLV